MSDQSTDTAAVAAAAAAVAASKRAHAEHEKPNPIQSFFVNILQQLPLPKKEPKPKGGEPDRVVVKVKESGEVPKTTVVTFPKKEAEVSGLKVEAVDADRTTNPALLWQVYAIGGFFVLRWAWSRWNERKGKKKPSNEERSTEEPPNVDPPPPHT